MKKIYNVDFLQKILAYNTMIAYEFNRDRIKFQNMGYKILQYSLTDNGIFKLIMKLKKKPLVKCCLINKRINKNDRVYPHCYTYPEKCEYYEEGYCLCVNHNFCLYQDTKHNKEIIEKMASIYSDRESQFNNDSTAYEDTKYGRIFSKEYEHLNDDYNIKNHRHNGR